MYRMGQIHFRRRIIIIEMLAYFYSHWIIPVAFFLAITVRVWWPIFLSEGRWLRSYEQIYGYGTCDCKEC